MSEHGVMASDEGRRGRRRLLVIVAVLAGLVVAAVAFQIVNSRGVDRALSSALGRVTAVVPNSWVERDRAEGGGSGLSGSARRTVSVRYEGATTGAELERTLRAAGVDIENCEDNSFIRQCYGTLSGRRVGISATGNEITVTVAERP